MIANTGNATLRAEIARISTEARAHCPKDREPVIARIGGVLQLVGYARSCEEAERMIAARSAG